MSKQTNDAFELQNTEFHAAIEFAKQLRRIQMTPIVDDDYPEVRWDYDHALDALLKAAMMNGRKVK